MHAKKNSDFRRLYPKAKARSRRIWWCTAAAAVRRAQPHGLHRPQSSARRRPQQGAPQATEIYRLNAPALKAGYDIIIVARTRCVGAEYAKMDRAFSQRAKSSA